MQHYKNIPPQGLVALREGQACTHFYKKRLKKKSANFCGTGTYNFTVGGTTCASTPLTSPYLSINTCLLVLQVACDQLGESRNKPLLRFDQWFSFPNANRGPFRTTRLECFVPERDIPLENGRRQDLQLSPYSHCQFLMQPSGSLSNYIVRRSVLADLQYRS